MEKEMATRSSTLAWKIPWTEKPRRLQFTGSQRVGRGWATLLLLYSVANKSTMTSWERGLRRKEKSLYIRYYKWKILKMLSENCQNSSMNLVKLQDTELILRTLLHSYTSVMKHQKERLRKQSHLPSQQKE